MFNRMLGAETARTWISIFSISSTILALVSACRAQFQASKPICMEKS